MPETKPPKCAKFATLPKPKRSSIPIKPNINHITINKYKAGGSPYLSNLDSISIIIHPGESACILCCMVFIMIIQMIIGGW